MPAARPCSRRCTAPSGRLGATTPASASSARPRRRTWQRRTGCTGRPGCRPRGRAWSSTRSRRSPPPERSAASASTSWRSRLPPRSASARRRPLRGSSSARPSRRGRPLSSGRLRRQRRCARRRLRPSSAPGSGSSRPFNRRSPHPRRGTARSGRSTPRPSTRPPAPLFASWSREGSRCGRSTLRAWTGSRRTGRHGRGIRSGRPRSTRRTWTDSWRRGRSGRTRRSSRRRRDAGRFSTVTARCCNRARPRRRCCSRASRHRR
mmetsp:Transcript_70638/g.210638  ORF Transcript_70638/g.210638 Transcript_70638/m.210638 type:complete len:263 (-) Transcript_70638:1254-2042(-)